MPSEPHRPTAAIRRVINPDAPARRQFGGPVRGDGHDQTFRTLARTKGTWPAISLVLPPVKELGEMAVGAKVKVVAIGNAKVKGSPD